MPETEKRDITFWEMNELGRHIVDVEIASNEGGVWSRAAALLRLEEYMEQLRDR
jgi:hypothetical protein